LVPARVFGAGMDDNPPAPASYAARRSGSLIAARSSAY
jgi:hypothetical protein